MKKFKIITSTVLIVVLVITVILTFININKQNHSGRYSSICTLTEQDKEWIIENFSQYNSVEELIVGINNYICKNFTYTEKIYIQHFDFAETVQSKTALCFDFAALQKCIIMVIAENKGWSDIKVYIADIKTSITSGHSYNFICVGDKKYYSDPTNDLYLYNHGQRPQYYENIGNLSFQQYADKYNEKIYNYH